MRLSIVSGFVVGAIGFVGAGLAACGGDDGLGIPAQCNPLAAGTAGTACMVPWPSSVFEVADASTVTKRRLAIPAHTLPASVEKTATDPAGWNTADGFSAAAPITVAFPGGVSAQGLPTFVDMAASLAATSPTALIDMTTGERVAHYAELDAPAEATPDSQALYLRPAARLIGGHRYAAVITTRVKAKDGGALPISAGFAALRDGKVTDHALLEAMRPRFADVVASLAAASIPMEEVVLAWDFTVASDANVHRDMVAVRDRTIAALASHAITVTIKTDEQVDDGTVTKRKITGTLDAPLFLSNDGRTNPGTKIVRDADGLPALQGFYQIPFQAIVPACAYTAPAPVPMVIYGHGLMGDAGEATGGVQRTTAAELCMPFVATDMRGMSGVDLAAVASALNQIDRADEVMEVIEQGMANHITLVAAMRTTFATTVFVDGVKPLTDPTKVYYYGLSQGAIMGTAVMAWEPTVLRGALGVGGANYSTLLDRSADWPTYGAILHGSYPDALDTALAIGLFQMRWDKVEGAGVVQSVLTGNEGNPPKQLLMQIALSDEQVPNVGSYWQARSMKIPVVGPTTATPWGLTVVDSPIATGSALVIMDGGAPAAPLTNIPPMELDPSMHNLTRTQPASRRQIGEFFATGTIVNECNGACTCQSHACD
ncbi:MAG: hypothetical protein NT062_03165 [Proteobacteria bacterium]|nr:hypothetical protein [Pseudomonadota bacterium]